MSSLSAFQKPALLVTALLITANFSQAADESVQSSNTTEKAESISPERNLPSKIFRPYRPNPLSRAVNMPQTVAPAQPPTRVNPPSKRDRELLDREKNWIFATPSDKQDEVFSEDEKTLESNSFFDGQEPQGLVGKFLANKPEPLNNVLPDLKKEQTTFGLQSLSEFDAKNQFGNLVRTELGEGSLTGFNARQTRATDALRGHNEIRGDRFRDANQIRMTEFENLFRPPNTLVTSEGFNGNPLLGNPLLDNNYGLQSQQTAPSTQTAPDRFRPAMSTAPIPGGVRPLPGSDLTVRPDVNERVFGPAPSTPVSTVEIEKPLRQPSILPIPQRKF